MKKADLEMEDDLRSEYDLKSLRVRKLGSGRKSFGGSTVRLEPDVAEIFPSAESVNEALRFLIKVAQKNSYLRSQSSLTLCWSGRTIAPNCVIIFLPPLNLAVMQLKSSVKSILKGYPWAVLESQSSFKLVFNCAISECKVEPGKLAFD